MKVMAPEVWQGDAASFASDVYSLGATLYELLCLQPAFDGDGSTPRGDMVTVLRAILLDPEAEQGIKLREPFLRYLHMNRGLNVTSSDGTWPGYGYIAQFLTQQHVLSAPSVFNFYLPNFSPAGELGDGGLTAPEFQITDASTIVGMTNLIAYSLFSLAGPFITRIGIDWGPTEEAGLGSTGVPFVIGEAIPEGVEGDIQCLFVETAEPFVEK